MNLSKKFTLVVISLQLTLNAGALAQDRTDVRFKFPHIQECYQLQARILGETVPRLDSIKTLPELKGIASVMDIIKDDFKNRSNDSENGTLYWFAMNSNLTEKELEKADREFQNQCVDKVLAAERENLEKGFRNLNSSLITKNQEKLIIERTLTEIAEQARKAEAAN